MTSPGSAKRSPLKFFILLFALSVPFWLAGGMAEQELPLPFSLPAGALVLVCPMAAALILVYREDGSNFDSSEKLTLTFFGLAKPSSLYISWLMRR